MPSGPSAEAPKPDKTTDEDNDIQDPKLIDYSGIEKGVTYVVADETRHSVGISFPGNVKAFKIAKELVLSGFNTIKDFHHHFNKRFRGRFLK